MFNYRRWDEVNNELNSSAGNQRNEQWTRIVDLWRFNFHLYASEILLTCFCCSRCLKTCSITKSLRWIIHWRIILLFICNCNRWYFSDSKTLHAINIGKVFQLLSELWCPIDESIFQIDWSFIVSSLTWAFMKCSLRFVTASRLIYVCANENFMRFNET